MDTTFTERYRFTLDVAELELALFNNILVALIPDHATAKAGDGCSLHGGCVGPNFHALPHHTNHACRPGIARCEKVKERPVISLRKSVECSGRAASTPIDGFSQWWKEAQRQALRVSIEPRDLYLNFL